MKVDKIKVDLEELQSRTFGTHVKIDTLLAAKQSLRVTVSEQQFFGKKELFFHSHDLLSASLVLARQPDAIELLQKWKIPYSIIQEEE